MTDDAEHDFVCAACGARLPYDPEMDSLECEFCGTISSNPAQIVLMRRSLRRRRIEEMTNSEQAIESLVGLGYGRPKAAATIEKCLAQLGPDAEVPQLIRAGLKALAT